MIFLRYSRFPFVIPAQAEIHRRLPWNKRRIEERFLDSRLRGNDDRKVMRAVTHIIIKESFYES